jgi:hypothetical protein
VKKPRRHTFINNISTSSESKIHVNIIDEHRAIPNGQRLVPEEEEIVGRQHEQLQQQSSNR